MTLRFERTYFRKGLLGELYHQKKLVAYCLEISAPNSFSMLHNIPDGAYYLRKPSGNAPGFALHLTLPYTRQRVTLCLHDVVTRPLADCKEPLCFTVGDSKLYMADPALNNLRLLFTAAIDQREKIIIAVKTMDEHDR